MGSRLVSVWLHFPLEADFISFSGVSQCQAASGTNVMSVTLLNTPARAFETYGQNFEVRHPRSVGSHNNKLVHYTFSLTQLYCT